MRYTVIALAFLWVFVPNISQAEDMNDAQKAQASIDIIEPVLDMCRSRLMRHQQTMQSVQDNPSAVTDDGATFELQKAMDRLRKCINELEADLANLRLHLPGGNTSYGESVEAPAEPPRPPQGPKKRADGMRAFMLMRIGVNDNDVWDAYNEMAGQYNKIWGFK